MTSVSHQSRRPSNRSKGRITHISQNAVTNTLSCAACCEVVITPWLVCDVCVGHFHPVCVKLTDSVAKKLQTLIAAIGWVCPGCRSELVLLRSSKSAIMEMVATVKDELQQLRTEFESYRLAHPEPATTSSSSLLSRPPQPNTVTDAENPPPPLPTKQVLAVVHKEFFEKERRKSNIVVTGMQEVDGIDDADSFCNLCETCLPVKPAVIRHQCRRLGRSRDRFWFHYPANRMQQNYYNVPVYYGKHLKPMVYTLMQTLLQSRI